MVELTDFGRGYITGIVQSVIGGMVLYGLQGLL